MLLLAAVLLLNPLVRPDSNLHAPGPGPYDPAGRPDSARWQASGEFDFSDASGNQTLTLLTTRFEVKRVGGNSADLGFKAAARYGRGNGVTAIADYTASTEVRLNPEQPVSPFLNASGLRDDVKAINARLGISAGADINLLRDSTMRISTGLALLQDYEVDEIPDTSTVESTHSLTRLNLRLNATLPIRTGIMLTHNSTFQPVANDLGNYLFTTESSIRVLLSKRLAFRASWQFNRNTNPAPGVQFKNDRTLTVGLLVQTG